MTINLNRHFSLTISGPDFSTKLTSVRGFIYSREGKCKLLHRVTGTGRDLLAAQQNAKSKALLFLSRCS